MILSQYLFNIFSEVLLRLALEGYEGGTRIGGIRITNFRYADDILLVAESEEDLQSFLSHLQSASEEMGLRINVAKTASMSLNAEQQAVLTAYGNQVPHCERFKYLGVIFTADASGSEEFQTRLNIG